MMILMFESDMIMKTNGIKLYMATDIPSKETLFISARNVDEAIKIAIDHNAGTWTNVKAECIGSAADVACFCK